ncbi:metal ABC transporter permease [Culicoidibacter larvae]|uniref:Metal ABC transporter permease n=1 Tax=Culicoidibacter larvae TaxID=2579976 RepID=A0A5R8QFC0_9FIRM|nr:metal ABC transporter permease [Culicoidibacter larvae]TLG76705.1 metal ABC transporter permease [Culicoidibacter larvae]
MIFEQILKYEFLQNAYIAGIIIAAVAPLLGVFVVSRRMSLIPDALSHVSLSGIALTFFLASIGVLAVDFSPIFLAIAFSLLAALFLSYVSRWYKHSKEVTIALLMSMSLGISSIFISMTKGLKIDITSYLFGSINAISRVEVWVILAIGVAAIIFVVLLYRPMLMIAFDDNYAKTRGVKVKWLDNLFFLFLALVVAVSMRIVGVLLISALVTLPIAIAMRMAKSFKQTLWIAIVVSEIGVLLGLVGSYYLNIPSGGTIVVILGLIFLVVSVVYRKNVRL